MMIAFSWIFTGSLVQFHLDRILEKDAGITSWSFIKPKPKDDKANNAFIVFSANFLVSSDQQITVPEQAQDCNVYSGDVFLIEKLLGPEQSLRGPPHS